jgi:hypothetical protein
MKSHYMIAAAVVVAVCATASTVLARETKTLRATPVAALPAIDGDLSDPAWRTAGVTGDFVLEETGNPASQQTRVYALSDRDYLYLGFRCAEPKVDKLRAVAKRDNSSVWGDDCVEFNFDPAGGIDQIYTLKVNSIGAKELELRGRGHVDPAAIRTAARVGRSEYTVEVALPFSVLHITRSREAGMRWRVNFERLRTVEGGDEDDDWLYTAGDWANPEIYGELLIPGGPVAVEAVGHAPLSAGRPGGAFALVANHSRTVRELAVTLADATGSRERRWEQTVRLAGEQRKRVPLTFVPSGSGTRTYRWTVRDRRSGAVLYSLERSTDVAKAFNVYVLYHRREVLVDIDTTAWEKLPRDAAVNVELMPAGGRKPRYTARAQVRRSQHLAQASLNVGELAAGDYEVRVTARSRSGKRLSPVLSEALSWPAPPAPAKPNAGAKTLNNFVTELLRVKPAVAARQSFTFTNPREGWVFFASEGEVPAAGSVRVSLDGDSPGEIIAHRPSQRGPVEAMRYLPAGKHTLAVVSAGGARLRSLVVRAIPELLYCQFQANPHVSEYGPYDWSFLQKYVLPHCTTVIGGADPEYAPYVDQWKAMGRHWIVGCGVPGLSGDAPLAADEVEKYWSENPGFQDPRLDGVIADEFFGGESEKYTAWTEALRRILRNPRFKGKTFYPYCGNMFEGRASREFIQVAMDAGSRFAWERYFPEQPTEAQGRAYLARYLGDDALAWRKAQPGAAQHMIVCLGYLSQPPESLNINPGVNYKVWMDMQFNMLANDPAFEGLYGVMEYLSSYADEENVRWAARLYRHYCVEGRTTPLTRDPYLLPHLKNCDFDQGLQGWQVAAAEPGSITTKSMDGYSWLEGRYPETTEGNTFLWMKRSARGPNAVSQTIKGLQPGRLYSLKMYTGDYQDLALEQKHAVSIKLDEVEVLEGKSFQHVFPNCYSHNYGLYNTQHHAWMNYHWRVFRATARQARITISDWASDRDPGGPIGQELMFNFVEVQPYLE